MSLWLGVLGGQSTATPPAGFVQGSSGFYYGIVTAPTQTAANWFANTGTWPAGATPAVPQNATQQADVFARMQATSTADQYLGWKRANDSSPWLGVALGTSMPYTNWDTGYPRSGLSEFYIIARGSTGLWRSLTGTASRGMVFQWPAP